MSRRQDVQTAEGVVLDYRGYGVLDVIQKSAPVGGEIGYAPGATWRVPSAGGTSTFVSGTRYFNIGNNGFFVAGVQNPTALWVKDEPTFAGQSEFGGAGTTMLSSGNMYRTILTVANGIKASATAALKIVDIFTLTAGSFAASGQGLQVTMWFNNTGTSGNTTRAQVVVNPTNTGLPASGAGVAGKTDGTVTVTGGTVIIDTGATYAPTGTVTFGVNVTGQMFKTGALASNTQESSTTNIFPSAGLTHTSAWADRTFTEANALVFAICLSCATSTNDLVYQGCEFTGFN